MRMDRVLEMYPRLSRDGFGASTWYTNVFGESSPDVVAVDVCVRWMLENRDRIYRKTLNLQQTSYGLKKVVEIETGKYVANGDFICAAIMCGYKVRQVVNQPLNVFLNMKYPISKEQRECGT